MPSNLLVAFCCNQHLFGVCHDVHRSARVSVSLAVSYHQSPGKAWPGEEGEVSLVRGEGGWDCVDMLPGVPASRQWWLHNETLNYQPRPSGGQPSHHHISGTSVTTHVTLPCHTMSRVMRDSPGPHWVLVRPELTDVLLTRSLCPDWHQESPVSAPPPARAAATYAEPSPALSSTAQAGQACVWLLPLNELLQCWAQADAAWFRFSGLGCSNIPWRTRSDYRY